MQLKFPDTFFLGTSTAAAQIETAFEHDWLGVKSRDGYTFNRTCDHELHFAEDAAIIAYCAPHYRMGLMWSKLQRSPYGPLHEETAQAYEKFIKDLKERGVEIMMVLHHFHNPLWFTEKGGWEKKDNINLWVDFACKVVARFGSLVTYWNTFNEPNVYVSNGWVMGQFPPFKKSLPTAFTVIRNLGFAHKQVYKFIKEHFPGQPVGISHNTVIFSAENVWGILPAKISDWWFMDYCLSQFDSCMDFFGMSYYAKISHDPSPITYIDTPEKIKKLGKKHDGMWEYYPQGLAECLERYWNKYHLPFIITENGVCTEDDNFRIQVMKDYMAVVNSSLQKGIDIRGYYWWSTFDNFEWNLGPTFRFGLYETNPDTKQRTKRPSADVYHRLAHSKTIDV